MTPRLKRRKRLFRMAKERLLEEIAASPSGWRALEFADPMLRGDPDVVDAAMAASDEKAFRYVDRYVLSENIGWQTVWPKFRRRCCRRIVWTTSTLTCLSACAALAWLLIFVLLVNLIWPPVICEYSNTTIDNVTGEEIWFAPYEIEHEFGHECNRSAYREDEREASFGVDHLRRRLAETYAAHAEIGGCDDGRALAFDVRNAFGVEALWAECGRCGFIETVM